MSASSAVGVAAVMAVGLSGCGSGTSPTIAPAPAVNPLMHYLVISNISQINAYQPACMADDGFADSDIGTKMPDSCCEAAAWGADAESRPSSFFQGPADNLFKPEATEYSKCYVRVAPGPFNGDAKPPAEYNGDWIRNYIGCENGKLVAHEECIPSDLTMVTQATYEAKSYDYPMKKDVGMTKFEDKTGAECGCSTQANFNKGPGCYIAFATLAHFGGFDPAVFVKVGGTCPAQVTV